MSIKTFAQRLASTKAVGIPASHVFGWLGQPHRRCRVLEMCGHLPSVVAVRLPRFLGEGAFKLSSANGTDQIAWRLWMEGWNGFERPMLDLFAAAVARSQTVVDVGANSGLYAMLAISVSKDVSVHAFEPLPQALEALARNVQLNNAQTRVHVMPFAVADQQGEAELFVPAGNQDVLEMSASLNSSFRPLHASVITVPVMTLDHFVESRGVERIDVLKVDVESQEHCVLAGARNVLAVHRPLVFLEVLADALLPALETIRRQHGYAVYQLRADEIIEKETVTHDPHCPNQLLVPAEAGDRLRSIAHAARLRFATLARTPALAEPVLQAS